MSERPRFPAVDPFSDPAILTAAVRRAVREAVLSHARAGNPVATWENGRVVWLAPEDVFARLAAEPTEPHDP